MTHMHIPDGILPVWLWLLGFIVLFLAMAVSLAFVRRSDRKKNIPVLGAVSAVMLVAMSLEILPIAYHVNLSIVAGILLGPSLGFLAAFITNLMLALMGHGGVTVIGLNTLLLGAETVLGHALFFALPRRVPVFWRTAIATVLTLFVTTMALIGIVAVSHVDPGLVGQEASVHPGHDHGHEPGFSLARFATMTLTLGAIGWLLEAAISGAVITFIAQVKPDLLAHRLHRERAPEGERRGP